MKSFASTYRRPVRAPALPIAHHKPHSPTLRCTFFFFQKSRRHCQNFSLHGDLAPGTCAPPVTEPTYLSKDFKWHTNLPTTNIETVYTWLNEPYWPPTEHKHVSWQVLRHFSSVCEHTAVFVQTNKLTIKVSNQSEDTIRHSAKNKQNVLNRAEVKWNQTRVLNGEEDRGRSTHKCTLSAAVPTVQRTCALPVEKQPIPSVLVDMCQHSGRGCCIRLFYYYYYYYYYYRDLK